MSSEQSGRITPSVLEAWGWFVPDSSLVLTERLFASPFRAAVDACQRWGDLLSTSPATAALMKEGLTAFDAKAKTMKRSEGRPCGWGWGGGPRRFLLSNEKWPSGGFLLFEENADVSHAISGYVDL